MDELTPYQYAFNIFVGIPDSKLYRYCVDNSLYEYIDDIGLLYLPGYDIKTKFFYNLDSTSLIDYRFSQRTVYDRKLIRQLYKKAISKKITHTKCTILNKLKVNPFYE